jgi:hypothetical protein
MHAVEIAAGHAQVARRLGATGDDERVKVGQQLRCRHRVGTAAANLLVDTKLDALGLHLLDAAIDMRLLELEVGNAVAQQATDTIVLFKDDHRMPDARQLLRSRQAGRAGADDGHFPAGLDFRRLRNDPAFFPALVDDRMLDRLDAHRVGVDIERTRGFARVPDRSGR